MVQVLKRTQQTVLVVGSAIQDAIAHMMINHLIVEAVAVGMATGVIAAPEVSPVVTVSR